MLEAHSERPPRELRVSLAGLGTVGTAVARLLQEESARYRRILGAPLRLDTILDRSYREKDISWLPGNVVVTDTVGDFLERGADIAVELLGGTEDADQVITRSLEQRRAVVTANKLLMARRGPHYLELAHLHGTYFGFEASVGGGIPILRALRRSLLGDRILRVRGILNGTCNFILSEMDRSGRELGEVLSEAQARGYAERDPSLDISGGDTADKLVVLGAFCFGQWSSPERIPTAGISEICSVDFLYARRLRTTLRMLGVAERHGSELRMRVGPFLVDERLPLSKISGVLNAVEVTGARLGAAIFSGPGAGGEPTAVSVAGDILNAALWRMGSARAPSPRLWEEPASPATDEEASSGLRETAARHEEYPFYLRFFVNDQPGIVATIARILASRDINIDSVLQEVWTERSRLPFVISIDPAPYPSVQQALAEISRLSFHACPPLALPILRE